MKGQPSAAAYLDEHLHHQHISDTAYDYQEGHGEEHQRIVVVAQHAGRKEIEAGIVEGGKRCEQRDIQSSGRAVVLREREEQNDGSDQLDYEGGGQDEPEKRVELDPVVRTERIEQHVMLGQGTTAVDEPEKQCRDDGIAEAADLEQDHKHGRAESGQCHAYVYRSQSCDAHSGCCKEERVDE